MQLQTTGNNFSSSLQSSTNSAQSRDNTRNRTNKHRKGRNKITSPRTLDDPAANQPEITDQQSRQIVRSIPTSPTLDPAQLQGKNKPELGQGKTTQQLSSAEESPLVNPWSTSDLTKPVQEGRDGLPIGVDGQRSSGYVQRSKEDPENVTNQNSKNAESLPSEFANNTESEDEETSVATDAPSGNDPKTILSRRRKTESETKIAGTPDSFPVVDSTPIQNAHVSPFTAKNDDGGMASFDISSSTDPYNTPLASGPKEVDSAYPAVQTVAKSTTPGISPLMKYVESNEISQAASWEVSEVRQIDPTLPPDTAHKLSLNTQKDYITDLNIEFIPVATPAALPNTINRSNSESSIDSNLGQSNEIAKLTKAIEVIEKNSPPKPLEASVSSPVPAVKEETQKNTGSSCWPFSSFGNQKPIPQLTVDSDSGTSSPVQISKSIQFAPVFSSESEGTPPVPAVKEETQKNTGSSCWPFSSFGNRRSLPQVSEGPDTGDISPILRSITPSYIRLGSNPNSGAAGIEEIPTNVAGLVSPSIVPEVVNTVEITLRHRHDFSNRILTLVNGRATLQIAIASIIRTGSDINPFLAIAIGVGGMGIEALISRDEPYGNIRPQDISKLKDRLQTQNARLTFPETSIGIPQKLAIQLLLGALHEGFASAAYYIGNISGLPEKSPNDMALFWGSLIFIWATMFSHTASTWYRGEPLFDKGEPDAAVQPVPEDGVEAHRPGPLEIKWQPFSRNEMAILGPHVLAIPISAVSTMSYLVGEKTEAVRWVAGSSALVSLFLYGIYLSQRQQMPLVPKLVERQKLHDNGIVLQKDSTSQMRQLIFAAFVSSIMPIIICWSSGIDMANEDTQSSQLNNVNFRLVMYYLIASGLWLSAQAAQSSKVYELGQSISNTVLGLITPSSIPQLDASRDNEDSANSQTLTSVLSSQGEPGSNANVHAPTLV